MKRKKLIKNLSFIAVVIILYVTGLHVEVLGFFQRGLLFTGIIKPDIEQTITSEKDEAVYLEDVNFKMRDENAQTVNLQDLEGKIVFLNFWATWCPPCVAEMPGIQNVYEEIGDDVVFVLVAFNEDFKTAQDFKARKDYDFPIFQPLENPSGILSTGSLPSTFVFDKSGKAVLKHTGMADYDNAKFKEFLRSLM